MCVAPVAAPEMGRRVENFKRLVFTNLLRLVSATQPAPEKNGGGPPQSKTLARNTYGTRLAQSVLECASPLAL